MSDYNKSKEAQEIFKNKTKPKNPIKFGISLNEEQKEGKKIILDNTVSVLKGRPGTGKTLTAIQIGLDLLFQKEVDKIVIARPYITAGEDIGFLPGGVDEKLSYLTAPIYNIMHDLIGIEKTENLVKDGKIIIAPFGFLRGSTYSSCYVIIDEAQNATHGQIELMLGRLGLNSKMVFCGDMSQCDLRDKKTSGFDFFTRLETNIDEIKIINLKQNHRHPIVDKILDVYNEYRN